MGGLNRDIDARAAALMAWSRMLLEPIVENDDAAIKPLCAVNIPLLHEPGTLERHALVPGRLRAEQLHELGNLSRRTFQGRDEFLPSALVKHERFAC